MKKIRVYSIPESCLDKEINYGTCILEYASVVDDDATIKGHLEDLRNKGLYDAKPGDVVVTGEDSEKAAAYYIASPEEYHELFLDDKDVVERYVPSDIRLIEIEDFYNVWNKGKSFAKTSRFWEYNELYVKELERIRAIDSAEEWKKLLDSFARLYRYNYKNNILIEAQMPGSTFLADFRDWRDKYNAHPTNSLKKIRIFALSNRRRIRMRPEYELKEILELEDGQEKAETRGNYVVSLMYDISQMMYPKVPDRLCRPFDADIDIMADTLNRMLGGNPEAELVRKCSDINEVASELLEMYLQKESKSPKKTRLSLESEKYVLGKALNIPIRDSLESFSGSFGKFDLVAASKVIKSDTAGILRQIEPELAFEPESVSYRQIRDCGKFSKEQLEQFGKAYKDGLNETEISVVADPKNDVSVIHNGIESLHTIAPRKLDPLIKEYDADIIKEITKVYANPMSSFYHTAAAKHCQMDADKMKLINRAISAEASPDKLRLLLSDRFDYDQLNELVKAAEEGLSLEQIEHMAERNRSADEMHRLRLAFAGKGQSMDAASVFAKFGIDTSIAEHRKENAEEAKEQGRTETESNSLKALVEDAERRIAGNRGRKK